MILRVERSEYEIRTLRNEITRQRAVIADIDSIYKIMLIITY